MISDEVEGFRDLAQQAFTKLSSYIYFDKQNLLIREKLADFIKEGKQNSLDDFADRVRCYDPSINKIVKEKIRLSFLPKSVKENSDKIDSKFLSKSFYTNQFFKDTPLSNRLGIFIDAPFEIHLISVMWLLRFGRIFDNELGDHCFGNRLENSARKLKGRLLFKKYEQQYQKWWSGGVNAAKDQFRQGKSVTILNFDFKDYYHSIELNLVELTETIRQSEIFPQLDNLHNIFLDIHRQYYARFLKTRHSSIRDKTVTDVVSLPIGLLSSSVLGNWYLRFFDEKILKDLAPLYYGRYVDDLMLVLNDTIIEEFNQKHVNQIAPDLTFPHGHHYIVYYYIRQYLSNIFKLNSPSPPTYSVKIDIYANLLLQSDKFFIYQFNSEFSPQLLSKFIEEQAEKSSAFQFLSEDDDNVYKELDKITFESNFDSQDGSNGAIRDIEENKFKLSVYLSKLTRGSIISGVDYNLEEIEKVKRYFKGYHLLRNYFFWEKLLSLWIVREDTDSFFDTIRDIMHQIQIVTFDLSGSFNHNKVQLNKIADQTRVDLRKYLNVAVRMAVGLNPDMVSHLTESSIKMLYSIEDINLFRSTWLLRKNLMFLPLVQFSNIGNYPLYSKHTIDNLISDNHRSIELVADFYPYRIKLNECCQFIFLKKLHEYANLKADGDRLFGDFFNSKEFLETAFDLFCLTNNISDREKDEVKTEYFKFFDFEKISNHDSDVGVVINPIELPNSGSINDTLRVCLVNKYVDSNESDKSLQGHPVSDGKRFEDFNKIFDDVKKVEGSDIFIMPEICLPYHFIPHTALFAVYNEIAFITGVEHLKAGGLIFNFVLTTLPIKIFNDRDAILIPRLKNHYSPDEEKLIIKKRNFRIPKAVPYYYDLFLWRNVYFSVYYCFELADVKHRNILLGFVDVLFAPVWNKDIHYYNSLVESTSRDLHCFIVLANTTQYGDSRVTRPADHIRKDKLRIKGGTVSDHKAIVVVSDLEIASLRNFQVDPQMYIWDEDLKKVNDQIKFKPLPPDFPISLAESRKKLEMFYRSYRQTNETSGSSPF